MSSFGNRLYIGWSDRGSGSRGRGRGRGRGGGGSWRNTNPQPGPDIIRNPLGDLLSTISNSYLDTASSLNAPSSTTITNCKYVSSYNWLNEKTPTITVPGKPPKWAPLNGPQQLDTDKGNYFRDPNAARFPTYPTEPAVRAVLTTEPDYPTSEIDIFACGSTLGSLSRFVRGVDKSFRFDVELIGDTVFFIRKENTPDEVIENIRGYGHTFPEKYTTWDSEVKGSETHQRIVQYDFAGHKCLVRFECDGYIESLTSAPSTASKARIDSALDASGLLDALGSTSIGQNVSNTDEPLQIQTAGSETPQASLFDLKTRSKRYGNDIDMTEITPRLWITQIPNFIVAYHDGNGLFQEIQTKDLREDVRKWESDNQDAFKRLAVLIRRIIDFAKNSENGKIEVYRPPIGNLEIRKQYGEGVDALPLALKARWAGTAELGTEETSLQGGEEKVPPAPGLYDDGEEDFTACSEDCGYCGQCTY